MRKMLKFQDEDGSFWVNAEKITHIMPSPVGTRIFFGFFCVDEGDEIYSNEAYVEIRLTPDEVADVLNGWAPDASDR